MMAVRDVARVRVVREVLDHPLELRVGRLIDRRAVLARLALVRVEPDEVPVACVEAVVERPGRRRSGVGEVRAVPLGARAVGGVVVFVVPRHRKHPGDKRSPRRIEDIAVVRDRRVRGILRIARGDDEVRVEALDECGRLPAVRVHVAADVGDGDDAQRRGGRGG